MPTNQNSIMQTYLAIAGELQKILGSFTATRVQKDAAEASLEDLSMTLASHSLQQVEGRTAVLTSIILEMNGVIDSVRLNPVGDVFTRLNGLLGTANQLLAEEKGALRESGGADGSVAPTVNEIAPGPTAGVPGLIQLLFSAENVLIERLNATADPIEKMTLPNQIRKLAGLRASSSLSDDAGRATIPVQITDIVDEVVANLRQRPFDQVLGKLQQLGDEAAMLQAEMTQNLRGGRAETGENTGTEIPASDTVPSVTDETSTTTSQEESDQTPINIAISSDFTTLEKEYEDLFKSCDLVAETIGTIRRFYAKPFLNGREQYEAVENALGVPWWFVGLIHGLESSFNFRTHLHNGDPLTGRTLRHPPGHPKQGLPPFTWRESAIDAMRLKKFDRENNWSLPQALFRLEKYNGLGYRKRGLPSPYLWSFTTNYTKGKFVRDGVFDPEAVSAQCGAAAMLKFLIEEEIFHLSDTLEISTHRAPTGGSPTVAETLIASPLASSKWELQFQGSLHMNDKDKNGERRIQAVQEWCCFHGCATDVDGQFGSGTEDSVERFQEITGLPKIGVVDERTWMELTAPMRRALSPLVPNPGERLYDMTIRVAKQHLEQHPVEIGGDNCGPWVRLYMDGRQGSDQLWCAGFVCFIVAQAALAFKQDLPFKRRVGVDQLVSDAKNSGRFISESHLSTQTQRLNKLLPGCLFVIRKTETDWTHTGIVIEVGPDSFRAIEGNTNDEGSRNGFETCIRSRGYNKKDFILLV